MQIRALKELAIVSVAFSSMAILLPRWTGSDPHTAQYLVAGTYLFTLALIWFLLGKDAPRKLGLDLDKPNFWRSTVINSLLVFVVSTFAFLLGSAIALNLGLSLEKADTNAFDHLQNNLPLFILTLIGIYITSSFGEEVIYRGFLITKLQDIIGKGKLANASIVAFAGILFGFAHYSWGIMGIIQTSCMGWALGYFYLRYNYNLWITILAHAYMDTLLLIQMY